MGSAKATIDHEEIRQWVERRGGYPARVKRDDGQGDLGILRIDFPGFSGEDSLERVGWEQWLKAFEESELAFLHQDTTADGHESRFNKLVARDGVELPAKKAKQASRTKRASGSNSH